MVRHLWLCVFIPSISQTAGYFNTTSVLMIVAGQTYPASILVFVL